MMIRAVLTMTAFALLIGVASSAEAQTSAPASPAPGATQPAPPPPAGSNQPGAPPPPPAGYAPPAYAQPGYPAPGYGPAPGYYAPPRPPEPDPTIHNHDGFYLRMALGGGYMTDSETVSGGLDFTIKGGAGTAEFALGGTPAPGFVIGGAVSAVVASSPTIEHGGTSVTASGMDLNLSLVGLFVDYYFDPTGGLHAQGTVGYGELSVSDDSGNKTTQNPTGPGFNLGLGYEWWVGEQWGIGLLGRVTYASLKYEMSAGEDKHSVLVPALLFTATYH